MKKLLLFVGLFWSVVASAQFTPGQVLTAAQLNSTFALYAPLTGATFSGPVALPSGSSVSGYAPLASPVFTGSPVVPGYLTTASASGTYAPIASPTFTGTVTVPTGFNVTNLSGQANFNINGATGNSRQFQFQTAGSNRWTVATNQTAEAGGNLGSDFGIYNFDNTGTYLSNPLLIYRNSGQAYFAVRPVFNGNTPYDTGNLTIANYALLSGATFTGASGLSYSNASFTLNDTSATNKAQVLFQKNGTNAWALSNSSTANTLAIDRFVSGSYVDSPIQVSNSTGIVTITNALSISQTAGIVGTTAANNANAGSVGEFQTATSTAVTVPTGTATNITTLSLTAGDWEVSGNITFIPTGQLTVLQAGCSSTSATLNTNERQIAQVSFLNGANQQLLAPTTRISIASTTTVYLVGAATFTTGAVTANGFIRARRVR